MLIRSLTEMASTLWELHEDQVYDLPDEEALRFIEQGLAEAMPDLETASYVPDETAARPNPRIRKATKR